MISIDGGLKSGSGTLVRDAVALCALTGETLHLFNIRARRLRPGLRPQHLSAVRAAAEVCGGRLIGDEPGSREIRLAPGSEITGGDYRWEIGTAGSTTMLAMTILPLLLYAGRRSRVRLVGGLFQDFAPSAFHLQQVLLAVLRAMGAEISLAIVQPGYAPRGIGEIEMQVEPLHEPLRPLVRCDSGVVERIEGMALASLLEDRRVADRMAAACEGVLAAAGYSAAIQRMDDMPDRPAFSRPASQPGACLAVWAQTSTGCRLGADMAGKMGRSSETIGRTVARKLLEDLESGATVDRFLADQLVPFAALAKGVSEYRIPRLTEHVESRLWLAETILGVRASEEGKRLRLSGVGWSR
ncbi:MAG: RNA 3'-terminal phosphate cyclase [Thermodesulfobacteriota bacterium]|nr:RNA 3'-terminal phosphate cyclase [Thermodesulfobacteriota bacterium]